MINYVVLLSCSGDEFDDEEPLDWLPIAPEIEDPEEAGWGHLEVHICIVYFMYSVLLLTAVMFESWEGTFCGLTNSH